MSCESPDHTTNYIDGPEEEYTDCVHVLTEQEVIQPGSMKIQHISVKTITVKIDFLIFSCFIISFDAGLM